MRMVFFILGLCALGLAAYVQAQPGGGGRMGGMSMMRGGVESDWAMIMEEMAAIPQDLEKEYNEIMSEGQRKKLAELKAAQQGAWQRGGQRGGTQGGQRGGGR